MMSPTPTVVGATSSGTSAVTSYYYYPSVARSEELLSCARTLVKMAQRQQTPSDSNRTGESDGWSQYRPADMHLYPLHLPASLTSSTSLLLEDGLALLRTMEGELQQLERLVKRRGQTNDPTQEITRAVHRLEADTQELSQMLARMVPTDATGQCRRHWEVLQQWFQSVARKQGDRLQAILKVRGRVLEEQQRRRQRFQAPSAQTRHTTAAYQDNPLFQIPQHKANSIPSQSSNGSATHPRQPPETADGSPRSAPTLAAATTRAHGSPGRPPTHAPHTTPAQRTVSTSAGFYASSTDTTTSLLYQTSSVGYGGTTATRSSSSSYYYGGVPASATGMRQRRTMNQDSEQQAQQQAQILLQQQQEQRATQQRLQEARQAERSLAELGTLFGKMSSLISQQSEVMEKIEDDVEAACGDVTAGHKEITTLYSIKKGNRALILKVFGLLIFFIIFMRLYARK